MTQKPRELTQSRIRLDKRGFVIPATLRKALRLNCGDKVVMSWKDDEICITKAPRSKAKMRKRTRR